MVLYADDLAPVLERVRVAGGEIVKPVFGFPGGSRFHFREPGGTTLAVLSARSCSASAIAARTLHVLRSGGAAATLACDGQVGMTGARISSIP